MSMQDKDIDQLFSSTLDNYEIEPSSRVWAGITQELDANKKRGTIIPMLRIAASVAIVITAGVYFWPKQQGINKGDAPKQLASGVKPQVKKQPVSAIQPDERSQPVDTKAPLKPALNTQPKAVYAVQHRKATSQKLLPTTTTQVTNTPKTEQPPITQPDQVLAAVPTQTTQPVAAIRTAVVPEDIDLKVAPSVTANPPVALADVQPAKKRKVRGLGGLLNAAIGLVDRREDKLIEFADKEDGATISGINLGIVAIKKNNNK